MNKLTAPAYIQARGKSYSVELHINKQKLWIGRIDDHELANHIKVDVKNQLMEAIS
jgi:hypothetical protein